MELVGCVSGKDAWPGNTISRYGLAVDSRADAFPEHSFFDIAILLEIKDQDWHIVFHAMCDRSAVHESQVLTLHGSEIEMPVENRVRIFFRIIAVDTIDSGCLEKDVGVELHGPQCSGCVGRDKGPSRASGENNNASFVEVPRRAATDIRLTHAIHADGGHQSCLAFK